MGSYSCSMGVDPGENGGISLLIPGKNPILHNLSKRTEKDIWELVNSYTLLDIIAVVEGIVPGYKGTGKSSMSKLYGNYRMLRAFLTAANIPYETIRPQVWHKGLNITARRDKEPTDQWKKRLKTKAQQLYPRIYIDIDVADSLLIAHYCREKYAIT